VQVLASEKAIMIRKRFIYPTLAAAAAVGAVLALAPVAGHASPLRQAFQVGDLDASGFIEPAELKAPPEGFALAANAGAQRSTAGARRFQGPDAAAQALAYIAIASVDQNADGRLSYSEYRGLMISSGRQTFANRDTNGDRALTEAEFVVILLMNDDQSDRPGAWPATAQEIAASPFLTDQKLALQARFRTLDRNHDGRVTGAEFTQS
jgi:Ca2+-binding EF-hand superfamily protein